MSPTKLPPSFSSARPTHRLRSPAALSSMLLRLAVAGDHHPGHERVERAEPDHGQDRRERDDPLRVARLLAVRRGGLEADPRPEGEEQADGGAAGGDALEPEPAALGQRLEGVDRVDRLGHEPVGTAAGEQHGERERAEQHDLGDQGDAEDERGDADVEVAEHADQHDADQREDEPVDVPAEPAVEAEVGEVGEDADQRALEDDVGHRREDAGRHAPDRAEAVGDEAVEGAGRGDVLRHLDEADGEQRQHDRGDQEAGRARRCRCRSRSRSGVLPVMAVIGAAFATAMKSTPNRPIAPAFSACGCRCPCSAPSGGALSLVVT